MSSRNGHAKSIAEVFGKVRADYEIAKASRFKRKRTGTLATGSGHDYHYRTEASYFGAMETARDLMRNNPFVGQAVRRLVANVLRDGFTLDMRTGDPGVDAAIAADWSGWSEDAEQCDLSGEHDFRSLERLTLQSVIGDGDILTLLLESGQLQTVEAHRLRTPKGKQSAVVHGVLLDEYRRRKGYWVTKEDVDPMSPVPKLDGMTLYPAKDDDGNPLVLHHYLPDRVSQTRGYTAFAPIADMAGQIDDLFFAQLTKAQMAACISIFREMEGGTRIGLAGGLDETTETRPAGTTRTLGKWEPGLEVFGYAGEKLQGFSPNIPNPEFFEHAKLILTVLAINLDLPVAVLLLDPSLTNFSGWRGAIDQARQRFRAIQRWLVGSFHRPILRWRIRRLLAADPAMQSVADAGLDVFRHVWHPPTFPYIEPTADAMGDLIQERGLLNSKRRLCAQRGIAFDDLLTEIIEDRSAIVRAADAAAKKLNAELGLQPPLTWRDIAQWSMPEGINVSITQPPPGASSPAGQPELVNAPAQ